MLRFLIGVCSAFNPYTHEIPSWNNIENFIYIGFQENLLAFSSIFPEHISGST
jgi:hypothetical protein